MSTLLACLLSGSNFLFSATAAAVALPGLGGSGRASAACRDGPCPATWACRPGLGRCALSGAWRPAFARSGASAFRRSMPEGILSPRAVQPLDGRVARLVVAGIVPHANARVA